MGRTWIKLWVNEWLDGTTRYEMSGAQRAFWIDLLALAGRSRCDGVICAGRAGERFIGYPLSRFEVLDAGKEIKIPATLELFEKTGKIKIEITSEAPIKLYKITILNWSKYQSEYERQKGYRKGYKSISEEVTATVTTQHTKKLLVEGEIERETEKPKDEHLQAPTKQVSGEAVDVPKSSADAPSKGLAQQRGVSLNPRDFRRPKRSKKG